MSKSDYDGRGTSQLLCLLRLDFCLLLFRHLCVLMDMQDELVGLMDLLLGLANGTSAELVLDFRG